MALADKEKIDAEQRLAEEAGRAGDAAGMVKHLFESSLMDKLAHFVRKQYFGALSSEEVDDCLAEAVSGAFEALRQGRNINSLHSYLLKATKNLASDLAADKPLPFLPGAEERIEAPSSSKSQVENHMRDTLRQRALAQARQLLPQIGQENIRRVMDVLLDAIEKGIPDITDRQIAEITDLKEDTVRRLKNRAIERLTKLAEAAGYHFEQYQVADEDDSL